MNLEFHEFNKYDHLDGWINVYLMAGFALWDTVCEVDWSDAY